MGNKNAHMVISKEDFVALHPDERDYIFYSTLNSIEQRVSYLEVIIPKNLGLKILKLEKRKIVDKGVAAISGFLGGLAGMLGIKFGGLD